MRACKGAHAYVCGVCVQVPHIFECAVWTGSWQDGTVVYGVQCAAAPQVCLEAIAGQLKSHESHVTASQGYKRHRQIKRYAATLRAPNLNDAVSICEIWLNA